MRDKIRTRAMEVTGLKKSMEMDMDQDMLVLLGFDREADPKEMEILLICHVKPYFIVFKLS